MPQLGRCYWIGTGTGAVPVSCGCMPCIIGTWPCHAACIMTDCSLAPCTYAVVAAAVQMTKEALFQTLCSWGTYSADEPTAAHPTPANARAKERVSTRTRALADSQAARIVLPMMDLITRPCKSAVWSSGAGSCRWWARPTHARRQQILTCLHVAEVPGPLWALPNPQSCGTVLDAPAWDEHAKPCYAWIHT
jgi:hypothetical protein